MSTSVVIEAARKARAPRTPGAVRREHVLQAARRIFCRAGFDQVGLREIGQAAGVDAAMIVRLFGSKEALFAQIAETAFDLEPSFAGPVEQLGETIARHLMQPMPAPDEAQAFDEFQFLLRSAASPAAAPILSASLHASIVGPLAERIGGAEAAGRAALITAYVLGFATLRFALTSPAVEDADRNALTARLAQAIQDCVTG